MGVGRYPCSLSTHLALHKSAPVKRNRVSPHCRVEVTKDSSCLQLLGVLPRKAGEQPRPDQPSS